jgi:hypothetical protein
LSGKPTPEILWIDPASIRFKISPVEDLRGEVPGEWDRERRFPLADAIKHRAIAQRYRDGARWEDTDLFRDAYARRLDAGEAVRGAATMKALLAQYYDRVDGMFASLERDGFRIEAGPPPGLLIGRDGEVFIGNQGNHRLAMAQVLGLREFAGEVMCRYSAFATHLR